MKEILKKKRDKEKLYSNFNKVFPWRLMNLRIRNEKRGEKGKTIFKFLTKVWGVEGGGLEKDYCKTTIVVLGRNNRIQPQHIVVLGWKLGQKLVEKDRFLTLENRVFDRWHWIIGDVLGRNG